MNKQTAILMYDKYLSSFCAILKLLFVSDQTYYLHLYYFWMTYGPWPDIKALFYVLS